ncbi:MAG: hypothetical protein M3Y91_06520 [Actinomycetota bacterium]|nr:hypothetical protein [Actinomycetota bacterium]
MTSLGPERRRALLGVEATALVRRQWPGAATGDVGSFAGGVTLLESATGRGWVLYDVGSAMSLGAALGWAEDHQVGELHILMDLTRGSDREKLGNGVAASVMARQAQTFRARPTVWAVAGRGLERVQPADGADPARPSDVPAGATRWEAVLVAHGVQPVVEHGALRGDVLGLEVARLVGGEAQGWRLAVGVGDHDRDARREMVPDEDPLAALDQVVALVRTWRSPGARLHPANTLAPERWLRSIVTSRPLLAGAADLVPLAPPVERTDLRHRSPAPAAGTDLDGRPVVVVCSTGVDIDLVPSAADSRLLDGRAARLVIVVPGGDDHPLTRRLAARLEEPPDVVTVRRDWRALMWASAS